MSPHTQYLSSSGSTSSCLPSTSTRICGNAASAAFWACATLDCLLGFVFLVLTLTAAPPSWLDCVMVPGASLLLRRPAAVVGPFGVASGAGVLRVGMAGVGVRARG